MLTVGQHIMPTLLEYVGTVHIIMGVYRGNPIALYLTRTDRGCKISPQVYPWNDVVGTGETPNKAAADFEEKWKTKGLAPDMFTGPHWEGGIKPEKPAPPKPAAIPKPPAAPSAEKPSAPSSEHIAKVNAAAPSGSGDKPVATPKPTAEKA
jgi:hypothetical protein